MASGASREREVAVSRRGRPPTRSVDYRFGVFEVRTLARQLLIQGQPAAIGKRAFDVLVALIERPGRLVTKDELLDLVWPGLVVEENNLQVQVSTLRRLVGQDAIATVPGHGYRFALDATEIAAAPPEPIAAARHNLGRWLTSFVGRQREFADLRAMLSGHRCVTLTGVGGIGKTRLAVELAATLIDAYHDGVWFVDVARLSDPRFVAPALASVLGVRAEGDRLLIEALRRFVAERELLVVLDNCEHLLAACAQLAADLLQAGPNVAFLATSRESLHIAGEAAYPVPTLPASAAEAAPDGISGGAAAQLFADRAAAANPAFALTMKDAAAVARICHDLDGIPLAIELAAARMRAMSVEAIAARLSDRFRLLKSGSVVGPPRQQTLRGAIDWSHELLAPAERTLFHRLAAFAGGFVLDAVTAVGTDDEIGPDDTLDLLGNLVDKSLVVFDPQHERYRMLETVRQYARERLSTSGEEARIRDRHLRFYVELGGWARGEMNGRGQARCVARLDFERENLLLAFEHARGAPGGATAALAMIFDYFIWFTYKDFELWHRVTLDVLAWPDAGAEDAARSRALFVAGFLAQLRGRYDDAHALAQESTRIARTCGDPLVLAEGLYDLGLAAAALNRPRDAERDFVEGLELARGNALLTGMLCSGLGELYSQQGKFDRAEPLYLDALAAFPDNAVNSMIALANLARNAIASGARAKATSYLRETAAIGEPTISLEVALAFLWNASGLASLCGDWARALRLQGAAEALQERCGYDVFTDAPFYEHRIATASNALGESASCVANVEGRALDTGTAIAEALAWLETLRSDEGPIAKGQTP